jgi:hypothetical protein
METILASFRGDDFTVLVIESPNLPRFRIGIVSNETAPDGSERPFLMVFDGFAQVSGLIRQLRLGLAITSHLADGGSLEVWDMMGIHNDNFSAN